MKMAEYDAVFNHRQLQTAIGAITTILETEHYSGLDVDQLRRALFSLKKMRDSLDRQIIIEDA